MIKKIFINTFPKILVILWSIIIIGLYLGYHPEYFLAIAQNPYFGTILICAVLAGLNVWLRKKFSFFNSGIFDYMTIMIFILVIARNVLIENQVVTNFGPIQIASFFRHNFGIHLAALFVIFTCHSFGILLSRRIGIADKTESAIVSIGFGIVIITSYLFALASISMLYWWMVWPVVLVPFLFAVKSNLSFLKLIFITSDREEKFDPITAGLRQFTLIFIAFFFVGAYKLFPLGFDSAALYQNASNLLAQNHSHLQGMQAYNWSLFTSLGPLLFGQIGVSIFLSHVFLLPCLWALFYFCEKFSSTRISWLTIALVVATPMIAFLGFVDAKIDLGFNFILLTTLILTLHLLQNQSNNDEKTNTTLTALIGLMLGFAMGVKYLALFGLIAAAGILVFYRGKRLALLSWMFFAFGTLFLIGASDFGYISLEGGERYLLTCICYTVSAFYIWRLYKRDKSVPIMEYVKPLGIIGVGFVLAFLPWGLKNTLESGEFSSSGILYGATRDNNTKVNPVWLQANNINYRIPDRERKEFGNRLGIEPSSPIFGDNAALMKVWKSNKRKKSFRKSKRNKQSTGIREEIHRYIGYEKGAPKYFSLPYDVSFGNNNSKRGNNIGYLFILFLPLIWLFKKRSPKYSIIRSSLGILGLLVIGAISFLATFDSNKVHSISDYVDKRFGFITEHGENIVESVSVPILSLMNSGSSIFSPLYEVLENMPFFATFILLSVISLLILYFSSGNKEENPNYTAIKVFTVSFGALWFWFGNGINYYGLVMWFLLIVMITYWVGNLSNRSYAISNFLKYWSWSAMAFYLFINLFLLFSPQNDKWDKKKELFNIPFLYQASSNMSSDEAINQVMPIVSKTIKALEQFPEGKVYRVGTFMNYHISNNRERVIEDNQLNYFNKIISWLKDPRDFVNILKKIGIKYIVFDLKIASIDKTPEQSLVKKATNFVTVLNNSSRIKLLYTDRVVKTIDPNTGLENRENGLVGTILEGGSLAVFLIE